jgi:site-specific recombinase XerD
MRLTKRGAIYRVEWTDSDGRHRVSTGESDKQKAREAGVRIMLGGARRGGATKGDTLRSWLHRTYETVWKASKSAYTCWCNIQTVERDELADLRVEQIDYDALTEYAQRLDAQGLTPATINRRLSLISRALTEAHKAGAIRGKPPFPTIKENNRKEIFLSVEDEQALITAADKLTHWYERTYMRALIVFLVDSGARLSEALGMTADSLRFEGAGYSVLFPDTKSGKPRRVPLTTRAQVAALEMVAFPSHGQKFNKDWCIVRFRRLVQGAGLPKAVTLHTLRHTCASRLVQRGADLYRVKEWLGHSSVTVTERYAHLAPTKLDGMADLLAHPPAQERPNSKWTGGADWNLNPARLPVPPLSPDK